ncbi:hypothetical protein AC249_AIPGENE335 [Exaiptasia diaphana]|nr:hypothetical protein AC249_AIPGENE335 [Exaiptasia diaphana]
MDNKTFINLAEQAVEVSTETAILPYRPRAWLISEVANCNTIKCTSGQQCIMNVKKPLCIDCSTGCKSTANKPINYYGKKVCGSNHRTFPNLCALKKHICSKHVAVDVVNYGKCLLGRKFPSLSVRKFKALQRKELTVQQLLQLAKPMAPFGRAIAV